MAALALGWRVAAVAGSRPGPAGVWALVEESVAVAEEMACRWEPRAALALVRVGVASARPEGSWWLVVLPAGVVAPS